MTTLTASHQSKQVSDRPKLKRRSKLNLTPYIFLGPGIGMVILVMVYPVFQGVWRSFNSTNPFTGVTKFVGLEQYTTLFASADFQNALRQSAILVAATVISGIVVATLFALVLHHAPWGGQIWRTIVLIPWLISGVAVATVWRAMFSPRGGGVPEMVLSKLGLDPIIWLADPNWARFVIILVSVWSISPFATLIIYTGLKTIDEDLYEAAGLDGAGPFQRFRHITIPSIAPQFSLAMIYMSFAAFNSFDMILLTTGGGPGRSTENLAILLYRLGFRELDFHASATVMVVLLAINFLLSVLYLKILPKRD